MRAVVRRQYGGPEVLKIEDVPTPEPKSGEVLIRVKAFGLNRAEQYFRIGAWGEVAAISGIECVGVAEADPDRRFKPGQKVIGLMGGMGRTISGSYAEYTRVPASNVVPISSELPWDELAAIPESYATAWSCLHGNLALQPRQVILIRGASSALGQAAINISAQHGARVLATVRSATRSALLQSLGAQTVLQEATDLSCRVRELFPNGIDAVLDLVGNTTILDSLAIVKRDGRVCLAGFLGGGEPIASFDPLFHMPTGVHLSFFASAFVYGTPEYLLSDVPFQTIVDKAAAGVYKAKPARVFRFGDIQEAHRVMDAYQASGKLVVKL